MSAPANPLAGQDLSPHLPPEKKKESPKRDKIFITALVVAVIAALATALAAVCYMGIFPDGLLGGSNPTFLTLAGAGFTAVVSGAFAFYRWKTSG